MKGLPDSAIVGTYKRLHRKPKRKARSNYKRETDLLNALVFKMITAGQNKKTNR